MESAPTCQDLRLLFLEEIKIIMKRFITWVLFMALLLVYDNAGAEIILIVHKSVEEKSLSKKEIKRIFLGKKKKWLNGLKIKAVALKRGTVHDEFLNEFVNKTNASFSTFWKRAIVTGIGIPPRSYMSESDIVKYVSITKGAIGYISSNTPYEGVKILLISNK